MISSIFTALLWLLLPHAEGEDYVFLDFQPNAIEGSFEINFEDLRTKLGLAVDGSEERAATDVAAVAARVQEYIRDHFRIGPEGGAPYEIVFTKTDAFVLPKHTYAQYYFRIEVDALPDRLAVWHSMFYENDRFHRGLLCVGYNSKTDTTYPDEFTALVFGPDKREQTLDLEIEFFPSVLGPWEMIPKGIQHVWIGFEHALFLLALMLSTVLVFRESWQPAEGFKGALWNLAKVVVVFATARGAALLLAAHDLLTLPPQLVGSVVALSVILVALNNITGTVREGALWLVLVLGFFHGLELAADLGNLPFRMKELLRIVVGFNIGVEVSLLALVVAVFPALFLLRRSPAYQPLVLKGLSGLIALIALWPLAQSALGLG